MPSADTLETYRAKRDFTKTPEPAGAARTARGNSFVVQKHDATRLHYDLRLELDGALKSWAVTRGPSLDPNDKRLAVRTEDHPLDYGGFEGTIPAGAYGAGTVMLWDRGTWEPAPGKDPRKTLEQGHLHFTLHGERMKGEWLLVRIKGKPGEKRENWLLRKLDDAYAGASEGLVASELTSVDTGRTMADIASGRKPKRNAAKRPKPEKAARSGKLPGFEPVQLATLVDHTPSGDGWLHEMKYDGYRCLLAVGGGEARTYTRSGQDWSDRFAVLTEAARAIDARSALIDGEIVALDDEGRPSFQRLQAGIKEGSADLVMFAFDLLWLNGKDLKGLPLVDRKAALQKLIPPGQSRILFSEHVKGRGEALFDALCERGIEGVVSKRADAPYVGIRSTAWLKTKCTKRQEFIIVGWTRSEKARGFRSLLLGLNEGGRMRYAGKVGTGFSNDEMESLQRKLEPLERKTPPVEVPGAAARNAHWVKPQLVAEIAFTEFTGDGVLRHSSYIGLREDKPASEVTPEREQPVQTVVAASAIKISNPDRVIFPESGITKGDLAHYYQQIARLMLPWMADRPISLVRCPQGRGKKCFFQKHDAGSFGDQVHHVSIREKDGGNEPYLFVKDADGLLACVQMGTIEFHGWGAKTDDVEQPDRLVFDLDPDESLNFTDVAKAGFHLRERLAEIGLQTFAMLTGGKGLHVIAPLTPEADWARVKSFAERFSRALTQAEPNRFTATASKVQRKGRIFIDWLRNQRGATAVMPYSARARPQAPVAAPVAWSELKDVKGADNWRVSNLDQLIERAASSNMEHWGIADQVLPDL